ncbi:hypothetical protein D3C78_1498590 [compost metagenome]
MRATPTQHRAERLVRMRTLALQLLQARTVTPRQAVGLAHTAIRRGRTRKVSISMP